MALSYRNETIIQRTLDIFKILIDGEEVEFLEEKRFADALLSFVDGISGKGLLLVSIFTEEKIVEVFFAIASKLRLRPNMLSTWFRPTVLKGVTDPHTSKDRDVFPLLYLTLDYVHHDGRVGDFARTGVLYIIESASHSEPLEKWLVESDLATLMASGLGALYSQLSRKLVLAFTKDTVPPILSFSDTPRPKTPSDAEKTTSSDFQAHLATFLSYLVFWQDVLEHCGSKDIKCSLLDHFKFLFLQQLLYPSLMESSDADGGSSVAVLTYLRCIIESIDNPELKHLTLQYLLAVPDITEDERESVRPATLARRRKSQTLITTLAQIQEKPMPDLFTLMDLMLTSLHSRNQPTVTATLRLVSAVLRGEHQLAMSTLIRTQCSESHPMRTIDTHHRHVAFLFSLAENLISHGDLREAYDAHLEDARTLLESHRCSPLLLPLPTQTDSKIEMPTCTGEHVEGLRTHSIQPDDPLLGALIFLLENFLVNDIATNLALTQAFTTLISCGKLRLEHWLFQKPAELDISLNQREIPDGGFDEAKRDDTITLDSRIENSKKEPLPPEPLGLVHVTSPVFITLDSLVRQVQIFHHDIQQFDTYLAERRHIFRVGDDIDQDVANGSSAPSRRSEDSSKPTYSKTGVNPQIGSLSERLMLEASSASMSRSNSPRGRQMELPSTSNLVGRLTEFKISPSRSPSKLGSRKFSRSPLRNTSITSTPPKSFFTPMGPGDALHQRVKIKIKNDRNELGANESSETSSIRSGFVVPDSQTDEVFKEISLSHLLTNIIILQEFILELAAIIQVRAGLFKEVEFE